MRPGDYVQYKKWIGKITNAYENDIYTVELYNYRGLEICYRDCSGKELFAIEKAV